MFLKGYPLEAKNAPKNWNQSVHRFSARLVSFVHLGPIINPLMIPKFHNKTNDPKDQDNKIYTIVKGREPFYRLQPRYCQYKCTRKIWWISIFLFSRYWVETKFWHKSRVISLLQIRECLGSVIECLTWDQGAAGSSLTGVTVLWSLSKKHLF